MRVLHAEVGGQYGGSLRALELYLKHTKASQFTHDVMFYYPTRGAERLRPLVRRLWSLFDSPPPDLKPGLHSWRGRSRAISPSSVVRSTLVEAKKWLGLVRSFPAVRRLREQILSGNYDAVHVNNTFTYQPLTLWASRQAGVPVIAHARNPVPRDFFSRCMMRLVRSVVTVNRSLERELKSWGLPAEVHTCYDGVVAEAPDETSASELRASLVQPGEILVGSVGRLDVQKGYEDLVRAARQVVDVHSHAHFAIAGEGPLRPSLEKLIAELGLSSRFHLCGFQQDVTSFLAALDLFVCPSHWEGGPMVLVEALLVGRPVVTTEVGFSAEVVLPGRNGYLVPPGNPEALTRAMIDSFRNLNALTQGACRSRPQAASLIDPDSSARIFDGLLSAVAPQR
jgi:glycosyltransferase involved in cell wall biosynthesis